MPKLKLRRGRGTLRLIKDLFFCKRGICYDMSRDIMRKLKWMISQDERCGGVMEMLLAYLIWHI